MSAKIDLAGEKFGRLTVTDTYRSDRRGALEWLCKCECGNEKFFKSQNIRTGNTQSCGCIWQEECTGKKSNLFRGGKEKAEYNRYAKSTRDRGFEFLLSLEQVKSLFSANCHYCGAAPKEDNRGLRRNGIDRKNPAEGYYMSNVTSCCSICNMMKRAMTYDQFTKQILKIANKFNLMKSET